MFEVHRDYVDWSPGLASTSVVRLLADNGYLVFAVRDIHGNRAMDGQPVEIVPVDESTPRAAARLQHAGGEGGGRICMQLDLRIVPG